MPCEVVEELVAFYSQEPESLEVIIHAKATVPVRNGKGT